MDNNPEVELTIACGYGDVGQRLRPNGVVRAWIVNNGYGRVVDPTDPRPAKLVGKAAKKIADSVKSLLPG
jgi:hypothetical protein